MRAFSSFFLLVLLSLAPPCPAEEVDPLLAGIPLPAPRGARMQDLDKTIRGTLDQAHPKREFEFDAARGSEIHVEVEELDGDLWAIKLQRRQVNPLGKQEWTGAGDAGFVEGPGIEWTHVWSGKDAVDRFRLSLGKWYSAKTDYKVRLRIFARPDAGCGADAGDAVAEAVVIRPGTITGFVGMADTLDTFLLPNIPAGRRVEVKLLSVGDAHGKGTDFLLPTFILGKGHCDARGRPVWTQVAVAPHTTKATRFPVVLRHTSDYPEHYAITIGHALNDYVRYEMRVTVGVGRDPKPELRYVRYTGRGGYAPLPGGEKLRYGEPVFVEALFDIVPPSATQTIKLEVGGRSRDVPARRTRLDPKLYRSPPIILEER